MYISFYIVLSMPFYFCENMKVNSSKGFLALLSFRVYLFDDDNVDDVEDVRLLDKTIGELLLSTELFGCF